MLVLISLALLCTSTAFMQRSVVRTITRSTTLDRSLLSMAGEFDWKGMKKNADDAMKKSLEALTSQYNTLRAGAANPQVLDRVFVDSYGSLTPLNQIARVSTSGSQQLVIEPFDRALLKEIEKAISQASLNLTPTNDGSGVIRINIPPLTEDRRKELVKQVHYTLQHTYPRHYYIRYIY